MSALEIAEDPSPVSTFLGEVSEADHEEAQARALQDIRGLVKFAQRFYIAFAEEKLGIEIKGFLYRDKRKVARALVKREASGAAETEGEEEEVEYAVLALAEQFEDLVDVLQGDLDFGYSTYIDDFKSFHNDVYPTWLESLDFWVGLSAVARESDDDRLDLATLAADYRYVAEI